MLMTLRRAARQTVASGVPATLETLYVLGPTASISISTFNRMLFSPSSSTFCFLIFAASFPSRHYNG